MFMYKHVGSVFYLGFSSASASSGGGSGFCRKVPKSYSFLYVLLLHVKSKCSNLKCCCEHQAKAFGVFKSVEGGLVISNLLSLSLTRGR